MEAVNELKKQVEQEEEVESIVSIQDEQDQEMSTVRWRKQEEDGLLWEDQFQEEQLSPQEHLHEVLQISQSHIVLLEHLFLFQRLCWECILQGER